MKLSTKGRYGLRAMVDLAIHHGKSAAYLKDIANRLDVSMKYLDHIISPLKAAGLINRVKDGYILAKSPDEINCKDIITKLEGSLAPVECVDNPDICDKSDTCVTLEVWGALKEKMEKTLEDITLKELAELQKKRNTQAEDGTQMYHI